MSSLAAFLLLCVVHLVCAWAVDAYLARIDGEDE